MIGETQRRIDASASGVIAAVFFMVWFALLLLPVFAVLFAVVASVIISPWISLIVAGVLTIPVDAVVAVIITTICYVVADITGAREWLSRWSSRL